jgi:transposase-like protein
MQKSDTERISEQLDTLIQLVSVALTENKKRRDQIRLLTQGGIGPTRIARILGTTANTVKVTVANMRKAKELPRSGDTRNGSK